MPNRRQFLAGSAAALALATLPQMPAAAATRAAGRGPNIVLILADDLGYGELQSYSPQQNIKTPRIKALADNGLRFTRAYSAAPVCAPSRCSLLTSLHAGHSAVRQNPFPEDQGQGSLRDGDTTFAEVLRSRGYRTACIGKWGFGPELADQSSHPNARGFEEFYGSINHGHAQDYYPDYMWLNGDKVPISENAGGADGKFVIDLFEERALEFIDTHAGGEDPFLLLLTPTLPHAPNEIPDADTVAYPDSLGWGTAEKKHASQVVRLDTLVGRVVDRLSAKGVAGDTLIIITSDNGPHEEGTPAVNPDKYNANGPLRGYKRNLYEGGIRIPLIISQPGTITPGTTDRPTPQIDLLPTFAELAGAPVPSDIDGKSIAALLTGGTAPTHSYLFWMRNDPYWGTKSNNEDGGRGNRLAEAVRREQDGLKAVRFAPGRDRPERDEDWEVELYDLTTDWGETNNIAATNTRAVDELMGLMRAAWDPKDNRKSYGVVIGGTTIAVPGQAFTVRTTLGNASDSAWANPSLRLVVPSGWTAAATTASTAGSVAAGGSFQVTWSVTPPAGTTVGSSFRLQAEATATVDGTPLTFTDDRIVTAFASRPTAPSQSTFLSDLPWASMSNGWGPAEKNKSNGTQAAGDGPAISLAGTTYAKGLGVHAKSDIVFNLGGMAKRFTAWVGIDDFSAQQSGAGSVRARILGDGELLFDSRNALTASSGPKRVDVDVTGVFALRLLVEDANGNGAWDHTSWASPWVTV
ncbi:Tat pathway signal sequence domain protein [Streptomyces sp. AS58]|uniref:sulfatase-like hydrolase/transferase n=1 Tax=Streptomyces sp. AS58 TaxID=1519489 RepID=UPI0006ADDE2A|nr:sulfatase-like hydrolase/transferase [Streptomyces sp. AS58]KOV51124.1 Tat pathway signal sequence domain protein [Streptomyces sp. AS58]